MASCKQLNEPCQDQVARWARPGGPAGARSRGAGSRELCAELLAREEAALWAGAGRPPHAQHAHYTLPPASPLCDPGASCHRRAGPPGSHRPPSPLCQSKRPGPSGLSSNAATARKTPCPHQHSWPDPFCGPRTLSVGTCHHTARVTPVVWWLHSFSPWEGQAHRPVAHWTLS